MKTNRLALADIIEGFHLFQEVQNSQGMKKVNVWSLYDLGIRVHPLTEVSRDAQVMEVVFDLINARTALKSLADSSILPMSICLPTVQTLLAAINGVIEPTNVKEKEKGMERPLGYAAYNISTTAKTLETLLKAELENLDTYFVSQQMGYKTTTLISNGEELFYETLRPFISDIVKEDLRAASRCLAFELPTAVGFHILRAVEGVVLDLMDAAGIEKPKTGGKQNLGVYIKLLEGNVDGKILVPLDQIRALHRNELMHPDESLDMEQAASLFEVAKAAMTTLLLEIKNKQTRPFSQTEESVMETPIDDEEIATPAAA